MAALALADRWKRSATWDSIGRTLLAAFGERAGAIADDDLDARVTAQPVGEHVGGAIVEQIDGSVGLEINEQRSVAAWLAPQSNVIDAQHARTTLVTVIGDRM